MNCPEVMIQQARLVDANVQGVIIQGSDHWLIAALTTGAAR